MQANSYIIYMRHYKIRDFLIDFGCALRLILAVNSLFHVSLDSAFELAEVN